MTATTRDSILAAATRAAQAHGYGGLNFRDLATQVGIRAASIHYYFPGKADLGVAVARRYHEDAAAALEALSDETADPIDRLRAYPALFRAALVNDNRMCLGSFMAAEFDDLPEAVAREVQVFADVNIAWISRQLVAGAGQSDRESLSRARAIFAAVIGAQLLARSRSDPGLYDSVIDGFRVAGLLPA